MLSIKNYLLLVLISASSLVNAAQYLPSDSDVLIEMARRSGLPKDELKQIFSNCDASQTTINLCAYRDQVAADLKFKHAVIEWEKARDASCTKSANRAYGGGSMERAVYSMCVVAETEKMTQRVTGRKQSRN